MGDLLAVGSPSDTIAPIKRGPLKATLENGARAPWNQPIRVDDEWSMGQWWTLSNKGWYTEHSNSWLQAPVVGPRVLPKDPRYDHLSGSDFLMLKFTIELVTIVGYLRHIPPSQNDDPCALCGWQIVKQDNSNRNTANCYIVHASIIDHSGHWTSISLSLTSLMLENWDHPNHHS